MLLKIQVSFPIHIQFLVDFFNFTFHHTSHLTPYRWWSVSSWLSWRSWLVLTGVLYWSDCRTIGGGLTILYYCVSASPAQSLLQQQHSHNILSIPQTFLNWHFLFWSESEKVIESTWNNPTSQIGLEWHKDFALSKDKVLLK